MKEKKHYTPATSEFHIGFRYEAYEDPRIEDGWVAYEAESYADIRHCMDENSDGEYRVKYLDAADIEELGWVRKDTHPNYYVFGSYSIDFDDPENIRIDAMVGYFDGGGKEYEVLFRGNIKNYNELKRIMEQIKIPIKS